MAEKEESYILTAKGVMMRVVNDDTADRIMTELLIFMRHNGLALVVEEGRLCWGDLMKVEDKSHD